MRFQPKISSLKFYFKVTFIMYPFKKSETGIRQKLACQWLISPLSITHPALTNPWEWKGLFIIFSYMAVERGGLNF